MAKYWNKINDTEYSLYGEIVADQSYKWSSDDACPSDIREMLKAAGGKDITLRINSPGGDVFSGIAIYNQLKDYPGKITAVIDGMAASIASVIAMAADEIQMPENAYFMIHKAWTMVMGNADALREEADVLDGLDETIFNAYRKKFTEETDEEAVKALIKSESWLNAEETAKIFTVTLLGAEKIAASADAEGYLKKMGLKMPEGMASPAKPKKAEPTPEKEREEAEKAKAKAIREEAEAIKMRLRLAEIKGGIY